MHRSQAALLVLGVIVLSSLTGCHSGVASTALENCSSSIPAAHGTNSAAKTATVKVPTAAASSDLADAYDALHSLGLRVTLTQRADIDSLDQSRVKLAPAAGTRVPEGSTVRITTTGGAIGSPATSTADPHYRVPDFAGQPLSRAVSWANQHEMYWAATLPPVKACGAPRLFEAYRILSQQPQAGGTITQGVRTGGGFRLTPLSLTTTPH